MSADLDAIVAERVYLVPPKPTESVAHLKDPSSAGARCADSYGFWLAASASVCKPLPTPEGVPLSAGFVLVHGKRRLELCGKCHELEALERWPEEYLRSKIAGARLRDTFERIRSRAAVLERETDPGAREVLVDEPPSAVLVDADELERVAVRELDLAATAVAQIAATLEEADKARWNVSRVRGEPETGAVSPYSTDEAVVLVHAEEWEELQDALVRWKRCSEGLLEVLAAKSRDPRPAGQA